MKTYDKMEMKMTLKKYVSYFLIILTLITMPIAYSAEDQGSGLIDDSLRDMSVVLGSGAAGAILGLSTLSFAETPSTKWKNVAIGGAIGIVIGVGVVIFSQATRSASAISKNEIPLNSEKFASLNRLEFTQEKIAKDYLQTPSLGYSYSF